MNFPNKTRKIDISKDQIIDYSKDNIFYNIILELFILFILLWIPYCICVFIKKCCCVSENCSNNMKILLFISILKIEYHLVHGDEYKKETLYRIGLSSIVDKLLSAKDETQVLGDNKGTIVPDYINKNGSEEDSTTSLGAIKYELDKLNSVTIPTITKVVDMVDINDVM